MTTLTIAASVIALLLFLVGMAGIVVPVLPGSITILITGLAWAITLGGWAAWIAFAFIAVFSIAGMTCSYFLTGRRLKQAEVPMWPVLIGLACGIVGIFVIPFAGLFIGFIVGLYCAEWARRRDPKLAWDSSWVAIKALGIGLSLELGFAMLSTLALAIGTTVHFISA